MGDQSAMGEARSGPNEWPRSFHGNNTMERQLLSPPLLPSPIFSSGHPEVAESIPTTATTTPAPTSSSSSNNMRLNIEGRIGKPGKKRSRASRKGSATLFNTDTTNFRAMVQQFTGAPIPNHTAGCHNIAGFPLINLGLGGHGLYHQGLMVPPPPPSSTAGTAPHPHHLSSLQQQQQLLGLQGGGPISSLGLNRSATANSMGFSPDSSNLFDSVSSSYGPGSTRNAGGSGDAGSFRFLPEEKFRSQY